MQKFRLFLSVLCLVAAILLYALGFECLFNTGASHILVAGSIALLASAVAAKQ